METQSATVARRGRRPEPGPPEGVPEHRWRALIRHYWRQLALGRGGYTGERRRAVERCASLALAAELARAERLAGRATSDDAYKAELTLARAERDLTRLADDPEPEEWP
jgi:hypothetical protein